MTMLPRVEELLATARSRTGLSDFGDRWFLEPLAALLDSLNHDAKLHAAGIVAETERVVTALVNRLHLVDICQRERAIEHESVNVAAVIVGLPRTGSTLMQRLLSSVPALTALRWWEICNYAPWPGEVPTNVSGRHRAGQDIIDALLAGDPELAAGHPYQNDAADEETIILGQFFMGTLMEGFAHVPGYVAWLKQADHSPMYRELRRVLQSMQWFDPSRRGRRWLLRSSAHLASLEALTGEFPEARLLMTHRDPLETIPSLCSLMTMLQGLGSNRMDKIDSGRFIAERWAWNLQEFMRIRARLPRERFLDVYYADLVREPLAVGLAVVRALGLGDDYPTRVAMQNWLDANGRERHPPHHYTAQEFGLTPESLASMFADYRTTFVSGRRDRPGELT
jgi:hypothetical protein